MVDILSQHKRAVSDAGQVEEKQAGDVIEVPVELFDGEVGLVAQLACYFLVVELLLVPAAVAVVDLLLGDLLQSVAGQMKAGVAIITVQHLVGVVVEATEADLAVSLKEFLVVGVVAFGGSNGLLIFDEAKQHVHGLVRVAVLEVLEHCHPHQILLDARDL